MMYGALWDSVREGELDPRTYIELVVKNANAEADEAIIQSTLSRATTALNYYLPLWKKASRDTLRDEYETVLVNGMKNAATTGQRITYYRALLNVARSETALRELRKLLFNQSTVRPPTSPTRRRGARGRACRTR